MLKFKDEVSYYTFLMYESLLLRKIYLCKRLYGNVNTSTKWQICYKRVHKSVRVHLDGVFALNLTA